MASNGNNFMTAPLKIVCDENQCANMFSQFGLGRQHVESSRDSGWHQQSPPPQLGGALRCLRWIYV